MNIKMRSIVLAIALFIGLSAAADLTYVRKFHDRAHEIADTVNEMGVGWKVYLKYFLN